MGQDNTKEKDVLPPFDPPAALLSLGEWIVNWLPAFIFGGLLLLVLLLSSTPDLGGLILFTCLVAAFLAVSTTTASLWREVRELKKELDETRQQLIDVQNRVQDE